MSAATMQMLLGSVGSQFTIVDLGTATDTPNSNCVLTVPAGGVPAGALIVVLTGESSGSTAGSLADTAGNIYTTDFTLLPNGTASGNGFGMMFHVANCAALTAGQSITYTKHISADGSAMSAFYVKGVAASSVVDVSASATGSSASPSVTSPTPAQAGDLFVGVLVSSGSTIMHTQDTSHGWAAPPDFVASGFLPNISGGQKANPAAAALTFAPTLSASAPWAAAIVAFKKA